MLKILFFFPLLLSAVIIQTNRIEEMLVHVDNSSWALFDLDDTVFESSIQYGRSKWYWHEFETLKKESQLNDREAHAILYPFWIEAQEKCPIRLVEEAATHVISKAQQLALSTVAVTARHPSVSLQTLTQLESLGISFSTSTDLPIPIVEAQFLQGVWFLTDYNKKGVSVRAWLESVENRPSKIIFIDDSLHNLENLEKELSDLNVEYIGIHYVKAHERPFDPELAKEEWNAYKRTWSLSDES
jgi:hypothetical protein